MKHKIIALLSLLALTLHSCFPALDDAVHEDEQGNVTISVISVTQEPMTRGAVSDYATALSIFVYDTSGEKVAGASHRVGDTGYGTLHAMLSEGTYTAVAVAHNAASGNAASTAIGKVTFPDNRVTDTFWGASVFDVYDGEPQSITLILSRIVAMVRLVSINDAPSEAAQIKLYYTGGSSTLNGDTGYGAVNSRQTITLPISSGNTYDILTIPHTEEDVIKLTVTTLDASGNALAEKVIDDIPVRVGYVTTLTGELFHEGGNTGIDITVSDVGATWGSINVNY